VSYHIYTTKGLVLSFESYKEADRIYRIYTEEFGLVYARATGVRKEVSKLRAALEPFSFSSVSLIRGKAEWRLTSAALEFSIKELYLKQRPVFEVFARVMSLVEKLVVGEAPHPGILDYIRLAAELALQEELDESYIEALEVFLVSNILAELGHLSTRNLPESIFNLAVNTSTLETVNFEKKMLVKAINKGLKESHLIS
jgi:DNA repair protein RecO